MRKIITISREFGSGGRELGKRLSEKLNISCYDHQIIEYIAEQNGLDVNYVERVSEKAIQGIYPMTIGRHFTWNPIVDQNMKMASSQNEIIKKFAEKEDCIIIGRSADIILKEYNPFNIFVYASIESRLRRCRERSPETEEELTDNEMKRLIKKIDKERALYREQYTDMDWGDKEGYDLLINTTDKDIKQFIEPLSQYITAWFNH